MLNSYHQECCGKTGINLPSSSISGLTQPIIDQVLEKIYSVSYLFENFTIIDSVLVEKMYEIIATLRGLIFANAGLEKIRVDLFSQMSLS